MVNLLQVGAYSLELYLDFINLFISLLHLRKKRLIKEEIELGQLPQLFVFDLLLCSDKNKEMSAYENTL